MPRLFGDVAFRYDPVSEAILVIPIGSDGQNAASPSNPSVFESSTHYQIESGNTFVHNNVHTAIASGSTYRHVLLTGAKTCHLTIYSATSDAAPIWVEISEGDTYTGGSPGLIANKKRNSANTPTASIQEGVTLSVAGTHLEGDFAAGTKQSGGGASIEEEWILKPNTAYMFLARNDATGAASVSFHIEWYEV